MCVCERERERGFRLKGRFFLTLNCSDGQIGSMGLPSQAHQMERQLDH